MDSPLSWFFSKPTILPEARNNADVCPDDECSGPELFHSGPEMALSAGLSHKSATNLPTNTKSHSTSYNSTLSSEPVDGNLNINGDAVTNQYYTVADGDGDCNGSDFPYEIADEPDDGWEVLSVRTASASLPLDQPPADPLFLEPQLREPLEVDETDVQVIQNREPHYENKKNIEENQINQDDEIFKLEDLGSIEGLASHGPALPPPTVSPPRLHLSLWLTVTFGAAVLLPILFSIDSFANLIIFIGVFRGFMVLRTKNGVMSLDYRDGPIETANYIEQKKAEGEDSQVSEDGVSTQCDTNDAGTPVCSTLNSPVPSDSDGCEIEVSNSDENIDRTETSLSDSNKCESKQNYPVDNILVLGPGIGTQTQTAK
jgi:hypothetical protein